MRTRLASQGVIAWRFGKKPVASGARSAWARGKMTRFCGITRRVVWKEGRREIPPAVIDVSGHRGLTLLLL